MSTTTYLIIFVVYVGICLACAETGRERKHGYWNAFWTCFFLSPILGVIITVTSPKKEQA